MFESLSERIDGVLRRLRGHGVLTEADIREGLKALRMALLEADVHYKVVREFLERLEGKCLGRGLIRGISPGQQITKIVFDELTEVLGGEATGLSFAPTSPTVHFLVGLQGSGKTTTAAKLARRVAGEGRSPYLLSTDVYRPAAREQLALLAEAISIPVHRSAGSDPIALGHEGLAEARRLGRDVVLVDTAGRLHIDEEMMGELRRLREALHPQEVLLVADGMTGQDAVRMASTFQREVGLTGVVLTKMDGDARGGAALSIHRVAGCPIKFLGVGERLEALEVFHPRRMASRILRMGDVVTLVERAQEALDREEAARMEEKVRGKGELTLEDFLASLRQIQRMGPLRQVLGLLPGVDRKLLQQVEGQAGQLKRVEAIILSMTPEERRRPEILSGGRRMRVARGSGTTLQEVNSLLKQFHQMRDLLKRLRGTRIPPAMRTLRPPS